MLIGIDGNEANVKKRVGIGRYGFQLLRHLKKEFLISNYKFLNKHPAKGEARQGRQISKSKVQNLSFRIFLKKQPLSDLPEKTNWWQYKVVGPKFFWTQIGLPIALFKNQPRPDVFFTPSHYAPRFSPCPTVISIMDLSFIHFPEMFKTSDLWQLKTWTAYSVKKAKKIITISKSSKDDIIKHYGVKADKVKVIYPGKMKKFSGQSSFGAQESKTKIKNTQKKYGIGNNYILYVGTLQPRKNLVRLIEAFKNIKNPARGKASQGQQKFDIKNLKLVIVGKKGWMYGKIFEKVKLLGLEKEVIFTGFVPDPDLPFLYQGAKCFVLVSLYEGFGLPVLEALSYGVPVVVSNISSLPEIVGHAGILVDPYSISDISRGIAEVLLMDTAVYQGTIKKGLEQAKKFSWEKCAKETLAVLEETASLKS